jgi:hypothetical protein
MFGIRGAAGVCGLIDSRAESSGEKDQKQMVFGDRKNRDQRATSEGPFAAKLGRALEINLVTGGPGSMRVGTNIAKFVFRIGGIGVVLVPIVLPGVFNPFCLEKKNRTRNQWSSSREEDDRRSVVGRNSRGYVSVRSLRRANTAPTHCQPSLDFPQGT